MGIRIAADIGGTFTDLVALDETALTTEVVKVPTADPLADAVAAGVLALVGDRIGRVTSIVHGTTAGLNALLQRRGARTALVTSRGFRDIVLIGRGNHPAMYDAHYRKPAALVGRSDVFEIDERMAADGTVLREPTDAQLAAVAASIRSAGYESVAVCLLNSYANPVTEHRVAATLERLLAPVAVFASVGIAPEYREYERTSTTVMNAYVSPVTAAYFATLRQRLRAIGYTGPVYAMQSDGMLVEEDLAARRGVRALMSGPVGGVLGARRLTAAGEDAIAADMGGTSFDVTLLPQGCPEIRRQSSFAGLPALVPSVATLSVGAGGGSVAWTQGGGMRVGPRSSGARPGPVSYGLGGAEPTVTDADLVLGRLEAGERIGGGGALNRGAALAALERYGIAHGLDGMGAAFGIVAIANAAMAAAIRRLTVRQGRDPRDFVLVAFGGAGPVHAAEIAAELGIVAVRIPRDPGTFSAWGMLGADLEGDSVISVLRPLAACGPLAEMGRLPEKRAIGLLRRQGAEGPVRVERVAGLRYQGQEYRIEIDVTDLPGPEELAARFHRRYRERYGFALTDAPIEVVDLRVSAAVAIGAPPRPGSADLPRTTGGDSDSRTATVGFGGRLEDAIVIDRERLGGRTVTGPALIPEATTTTVVPPGWTAHEGDSGLELRRAETERGSA
jgi:N-methylhydantoinase A